MSPSPEAYSALRKAIPDGWAQPIEDYLLTLAAAGQREATLKVRRSYLTTMARGVGCRPEQVTGELLVQWFGRQTHWAPGDTQGLPKLGARILLPGATAPAAWPAYISDELPKPRPPQAVPRPAPGDALRAALAGADARTTPDAAVGC